MNNKLLPAIGIIVVTIILVLINEFTEMSVVQDYALLLIIAGMLPGTGLAKLSSRPKSKSSS